jgi:diguanylate cyclase (GGDEF)-like protein/PAS domain S-box-containing protein
MLQGRPHRRAAGERSSDAGLREAAAAPAPSEQLAALVDVAPVVVWAIDREGTITESRGHALEAMGHRSGELVGQSIWDVHAHEPHTLECHRRALGGEVVRTQTRSGGRDYETLCLPLREGEEVTGVLGVATDITDRVAALHRLDYLSAHDELTGLTKRSLFERHLEVAISRTARHGGHLAVLYLDLDRVKAINETLGHDAGDELLRQVAERLRHGVRSEDILARHSGDEFLVLLNLTQPDGSRVGEGEAVQMATAAARRLHDSLRVPFVVSGSEVAVDASIGVSLFPTDAEEPAALIRHADEAMYRSKESGGGGTLLYQEIAGDRPAALTLTADLLRAIDRDELELHYQPIVDLEAGTCARVEALVRWRRPERGLVPPGEFIPLAEETGVIERIGEWVVDETCRQLAAWQRRGLSIAASVNLSLREMRRPDVVERIAGAVEHEGLPSGSVMVEITESAAMTELPRMREVMQGLRARGVPMAIDDFGAGYSSLGRLRDIRGVETLKVDRSFVSGVPGDDFANRLVAGIIEISRGLDLIPLAEGIETAEQLEFMTACGCPLGQGFHLARPLPADELERWLASAPAARPA